MRSFRHRLRETLGIFDAELVDEDGDGGGGGGMGGDAGGSVGGATGGSGEPADTTNTDNDNRHYGYGFGAYWKGPLGNNKCPDGTTKDQNTGTCKKK